MGSYGSVVVIERGIGSTRQGWYLVWPKSRRVVRIGDDYGRHTTKQAAEDTLWSLQRFGRVELEKTLDPAEIWGNNFERDDNG